MKESIVPGVEYTLEFKVSDAKTTHALYPEAGHLSEDMPEVFATGFMIGLMEWACIEALHPQKEDF